MSQNLINPPKPVRATSAGKKNQPKHHHRSNGALHLLTISRFKISRVKMQCRPVGNGKPATRTNPACLDKRPSIPHWPRKIPFQSTGSQALSISILLVWPMVDIVQQTPAMERVHQRQHGNVADPIVYPATVGERPVATVMANHEKSGQCRARKEPGEGKQIPGRKGDGNVSQGHGGNAQGHLPPGFAGVLFENTF